MVEWFLAVGGGGERGVERGDMCEAAGRVGTRSMQRGSLVPVNSLPFIVF